MKAIAYGAVLGLLWLLVGVPVAPALAVLAVLVEPVTIAFVLGLATRPYLTGRRTT
ncbi:hypothetical protein QBB33_15540 [Streptomyces scabiei]|uniref:hypothetical protein n=1 Tax=Streptomyces scabiei TaxID=1930 RepID=UPI002FEE9367